MKNEAPPLPPPHSLLLCAVLLMALAFTSCAEMFQPKIPAADNNPSSSLDDLDGVFRSQDKEENNKLEPPPQFYIAPYYSSTELQLVWEAVPNAAYYRVERAVLPMNAETEPEETDFSTLDTVYGSIYTDVIIKTQTLESPEYRNKYYYRVVALNPLDFFEESMPTEAQYAMLFRAPQRVNASGGVYEFWIDVEWEEDVPGAEFFELWRSDFPNGVSASLLTTVPKNQNWYRNDVSPAEQGKDFYYMVVAINGYGNRAARTNPQYGYARQTGAPLAPVVRLAAGEGRGNSKNTIAIEWDAVEDADYYVIFRYSSLDSSRTRLSERYTSADEVVRYFDNDGLRAGRYFYYMVQSVSEDGDKILRSELSNPDATESFVLSPPEVVSAAKDASGVVIKWLPPLGSEEEKLAYSYKVYSAVAMNGNFATLAAESPEGAAVDAEGFISVSASSSDAFFRVATVNGAMESDLSAMVSPAPAAAVMQAVSQGANLPSNMTANTNGVYPVRITWKKPASDEPAFYYVQRSTTAGAYFSRITEIPLGANGPWTDVYTFDEASGTYSFIDKNDTARAGRKYYYRILSLNQLEQGSFTSAESTGWGALTHNQYMIEYNKTMKMALKKLTYMHKPGSTEKLGTETKNGTIGGTIYYSGAISGLGARIIIKLTDYAEFYIENDSAKGVYFTLNGNSNTSANMSSNGTMDGTVTCTGMYPGKVVYDRIEIKSGAAGGGTYGIEPDGFPRQEIHWTVGEQ